MEIKELLQDLTENLHKIPCSAPGKYISDCNTCMAIDALRALSKKLEPIIEIQEKKYRHD